ncbi:hypothetical protein FDP41_004044 [Naegleria fowleri]|uniref:Vacuolar protein 14 C-terminal Fig4-binding domain-containing protein n=1 Tax=Naegleria fowleri TaxID=5763 RepID=A0A6A5BV01_NAEFO|nr:uncharacterized protein FDP41_004044 [Naegleria fowleri]KAF0976749.1 hypothetical protein FDP41_004044 [Naegleria fowleri]
MIIQSKIRYTKDIVTEDENFNVDQFIPELSKHINTNDPFVRQFLLSWIVILDSVPDIDLLEYLPHFLSGIFDMLSDPNREILDLQILQFDKKVLPYHTNY